MNKKERDGPFFSDEKLEELEELCKEQPIWMLDSNVNVAVTDGHFGSRGHPRFKKVSLEYAKKVMARTNYERMLSTGYSEKLTEEPK